MSAPRGPLEHNFAIEDLRVLATESSTGDSGNGHIQWGGTYGPLHDEDEFGMQVVIATLHAGGPRGWASTTVGGLFTPMRSNEFDLTPDSLGLQLAQSSALETLYDFARVSLRSAGALVDARLKTPVQSPDPSFERFIDAAERPAKKKASKKKAVTEGLDVQAP